jgi:hypothetical protein
MLKHTATLTRFAGMRDRISVYPETAASEHLVAWIGRQLEAQRAIDRISVRFAHRVSALRQWPNIRDHLKVWIVFAFAKASVAGSDVLPVLCELPR